jgi:hypothetical protein
MSAINIYNRDPKVPWRSVETPHEIVGRFDASLAQYWQGNGTREEPLYGGLTERDHERLWFAADGRWVLTFANGACYLEEPEAEAWLTENGYATAEDRETYVQRLP